MGASAGIRQALSSSRVFAAAIASSRICNSLYANGGKKWPSRATPSAGALAWYFLAKSMTPGYRIVAAGRAAAFGIDLVFADLEREQPSLADDGKRAGQFHAEADFDRLWRLSRCCSPTSTAPSSMREKYFIPAAP